MNQVDSASKHRLAAWLLCTFVAIFSCTEAVASCGDYLVHGRKTATSHATPNEVDARVSPQIEILRLTPTKSPCDGLHCQHSSPRDYESVAIPGADPSSVRVLGTTTSLPQPDDPDAEFITSCCDELTLSTVQVELFRPPMPALMSAGWIA